VIRLVLAFLAVMALLASPVTAAAAQATCDQAGPMTMAGTAMPFMSSMDQLRAKTTRADPCCDPADNHGKKSDAGCAQACAAICGVVAALTTSSDSLIFAPTPAILTPASAVSRHSHEPPGLRRPPKSIA
jgi:hypothetical protein